jgi:hypothetical protein
VRWLAALIVVAGCRFHFAELATDASADNDGADAPDVGYFMSPAGDDSNPGTRAQPWRTFGASIPRLVPGDTLNLLDGEYDATALGRLEMDCDFGPAENGTAAAPITVRADHSRRAHLLGAANPVDVRSCAYWVFDGLHVTSSDDANDFGGGGPVLFYYDTHITARNLLLVGANRYRNANSLEVGHSSNVVIEDVEAYDFFRTAFADYDSHGTVLRRLYANGRGRPDIGGGYVSVCPGGDAGVGNYYTFDTLVEDVIIEGACDIAFFNSTDRSASGNTGVGDNQRFVGDIALGPGQFGFGIVSDCDANVPCSSADLIASNTTISQSVAIGFVNDFVLYGQANSLTNVTAHDAINNAIVFDVLAPADGMAASATAASALVVGSAAGVVSSNQTTWRVDHVNVFASGTAYTPNDSNVTNPSAIDPQLGGCRVYLPPASPMHGLGPAGGDVGADIRVLYRDGVATTEPYWRTDGMFAGCGAVIPGVNDDPTTSCIGVHQRLRVGTTDCPWP